MNDPIRNPQSAIRNRSAGIPPSPRRVCSLVFVVLLISANVIGAQPERAESPEARQPPPISGAKELLALYRVDAERLASLVDGRPIGGEELETLWRVLLAARRFSLADIDRWKHTDPDWAAVARQAGAARGEIFEFEGRLERVARVELPPDDAERFDLPQYFACQIAMLPDRAPATVYALGVPKAWRLDEPLDERVAVKGFFLKLAGEESGTAAKLFAAQRVAWYPRDLLGDLKMDVGLFDEIRAQGPLAPVERDGETSSDRECFYQLLSAAGRADPTDLLARTANLRYHAVPLLKDPAEHAGELVAFEGLARRAVVVRVEDPDIVDRLHIDHFYEVVVSVELEKDVHFQDQIQHSFPMVFCVRRLPEGMPTGERINEHVRIPGFYFKLWTYRSEASAARGPKARQPAPLFIGCEPQWIRRKQVDQAFSNSVFLGIFVASTALLWVVVWMLNRGDRKFHKRVLARLLAPTSAGAGGEPHVADAERPDFSNLRESQPPS